MGTMVKKIVYVWDDQKKIQSIWIVKYYYIINRILRDDVELKGLSLDGRMVAINTCDISMCVFSFNKNSFYRRILTITRN